MTHSLAEPIFWIAAVTCVLAELAILRSAFMPRPGAIASETVPHSSRGIEMIWAVVPAVALAILLAATWRAVNH
jgi:heme/copper-type cytochrome/quinol oxidase subunit 2